jgi:hypothetical protein
MMDEVPLIQTIQLNGVSKEEEVDELLQDDADADDLSDFDDEVDDPNEFRVHEPLPEYIEYKRKLSEVHRKSVSVLFTQRF